MFLHLSVILFRGGAWVTGGVCVAGGMCRAEGVCGGRHAQQGGGMGHVAGRHVWRGGVFGGACVAEETATVEDGVHPTGMHSCLFICFFSLTKTSL